MGPWRWSSGQRARLLHSDDLSSNPTEAYSFSLKFVFEKNENKQKEGGNGP